MNYDLKFLFAKRKFKKTKNMFAVDKMIESLYNYNPIGKKIEYNGLGDALYKKIQKKSIVFLIGDFIDTDGLNLNLLAKKHEVIAIVLRDRFEENPAALGNVNLVDPANYSRFEGVIDGRTILTYKQSVKQNDDRLFKNLKKWGVEYTKIYTGDNVTAKMMRLFI